MKVLVATAMYPSEDRPFFGTFVRTQVESLQRIGVDAEPFVLEGRSRKLMYARAARDLRKRLEQGDVDIVHAHYSYVGAVARSQRQVPVVLTFHGDDLLGTINKWGRTALWSRPVVAAGKGLARTVDGVIVQSPQMAKRLRAVSRVRVIPHEVDLGLFRTLPRDEARAILGLNPDMRYLLFAASPAIPVKRFPLAHASAEIVRSSDSSVELLVVHKETQERLALYMNACDALIFTSFQEGSPNVVKQAMACNLPIVSTDVGDVRELISETDGCLIAEPTPESFAAAVRRVLSCTGRTDGRQKVLELDGDIVAAKVRDLYEEVLQPGVGRRPAAVT